MAATPITRIFDGHSVTSTPLPPMRALDLVGELAPILSGGASDSAVLVAIGQAISAGRLRKLLPELLADTHMTVTEGGTPRKMSLNTVEAINMAFDGRLGILPDVVAFAVEVTYKDFFGGVARVVRSVQTPSS